MTSKRYNKNIALNEVDHQQLLAACQMLNLNQHQVLLTCIREHLPRMLGNAPLQPVNIVSTPPKDTEVSINTTTEELNQLQLAMQGMQAQLQAMYQKQLEQDAAIAELKARKDREDRPVFKVNEVVTKQSTVRFHTIVTAPGYFQKDKKGNTVYGWYPELGIVVRNTTTKSKRTGYKILATEVFELAIDETEENNPKFVSPHGNIGYNKEIWNKEAAEVEAAKNNGLPKITVPEGMEWGRVPFDSGVKETYLARELHEELGISLEVLAKAQTKNGYLEIYINGGAYQLTWLGRSNGRYDDQEWSVFRKLVPIDYEQKAGIVR